MIVSSSEYEEEWEKCVELCLKDRGGSYVSARELIFMPAAKAGGWQIPLSAMMVFRDIIQEAIDGKH